jgi:hypothetical protein
VARDRIVHTGGSCFPCGIPVYAGSDDRFVLVYEIVELGQRRCLEEYFHVGGEVCGVAVYWEHQWLEGHKSTDAGMDSCDRDGGRRFCCWFMYQVQMTLPERG